MCAWESQPMLMQTYGGQRTVSRVSLHFPTCLRQGFLLLPAVYTELTHSQASGNLPIIASHLFDCRQAGTAKHELPLCQSNCFIHRTISPALYCLLVVHETIPQASTLQTPEPLSLDLLCSALPDTLVCCFDRIWNLAPSMTFLKKRNHFLFHTQLLFKFATRPAGAEGSSPLPWLPAKHTEAGNGAGGQGGVS